MEMVGVDLFVLKRQSFVIAVDYYSGNFEVQDMSSTSSTQVITVLKSWFSKHRIPMTLISDKDPHLTVTIWRLSVQNKTSTMSRLILITHKVMAV